MFIKVPATRNKITPVKKTVPVPRNKIATLDSGIASKAHVATHYGSYLTIMSASGLELYDKSTESKPQRLVCVYPGTAFIVDSSDDDLQIFRI
jgi:hypothetical protein